MAISYSLGESSNGNEVAMCGGLETTQAIANAQSPFVYLWLNWKFSLELDKCGAKTSVVLMEQGIKKKIWIYKTLILNEQMIDNKYQYFQNQMHVPTSNIRL